MKSFSKKDVVDLIQKMRDFGQDEQARETYKRENALHPEWELKNSFKNKKDENKYAA